MEEGQWAPGGLLKKDHVQRTAKRYNVGPKNWSDGGSVLVAMRYK